MSDFALPDGIVGSEYLGVRVFCVAAPDPQQLGDQIALALGAHTQLFLEYSALLVLRASAFEDRR